MRRYAALFLFATLLALWPSTPSRTQDAGTVVQTCGISPTPYTGGGPRSLTMDLDGHLCATAQGVLPFTNGGEGPSSFNTSSAELIEGFPTSTLNTINNWQAPTANGTGVAATNAATQTTLSSGTTTTSWSKLTSIKTFTEDNPGYMFFQTNINIQPNLGATSGGCVLFGYATLAASPTCSAPGNFAVNCVCFETTTDGRLLAVVYATSSRLTIVDLSLLQGAARAVTQTNGAGQPIAFSAGCQCVPQVIMQNSGAHRALIYFRGDNAIFALEGPNGVTIPIAYFVSGAAGPDINALPVSFAAAVGPATIGTAVTIQVNQVTVARTSARLGSLTPVVSAASESSHVFKTSPGQLIAAYATNTGGTAGFLMIYNSTTVPADGAVTPLDCVPIGVGGTVSLAYQPGGFKHYNVGMTASLSSTGCFTKTTIAGVAGFISGSVQ